MIRYIKIFLLIFPFCVFAQTKPSSNLNDYKYVIVPKIFKALKEPNKYNVNTYVKMFWDKYNFETYFDDELPAELADTNCDKLFADIRDESGIFNTKVNVLLKDCQGNILFQSQQGSSREKDFQVAYLQALRIAFASFDQKKHVFTPAANVTSPKAEVPTKAVAAANAAEKLTAKPAENGYTLYNGEQQKVMRLFASSKPDVFSAQSDSFMGILQKLDGVWVLEYYSDNKKISRNYDIKF